MSVETITVVFFRLFNFAVLVGIFAFVWRRYGSALLLQEFEKAKAYLVSLANDARLLQQQDKKLRMQYEQENAERVELKERLFAWKEAVEKEKKALDERKQDRIKSVQSRMKEQVYRVQENRLYRIVQKEAIEQVRATLKKQYESSDAQSKFITAIVKQLDAA